MYLTSTDYKTIDKRLETGNVGGHSRGFVRAWLRLMLQLGLLLLVVSTVCHVKSTHTLVLTI
jgi:hypothetical protein